MPETIVRTQTLKEISLFKARVRAVLVLLGGTCYLTIQGVFGLYTNTSLYKRVGGGRGGQSCAMTTRGSSSITCHVMSSQVPAWNICVSAQDHKSMQAIVGITRLFTKHNHNPNAVANRTRLRLGRQCRQCRQCRPLTESNGRGQSDNFYLATTNRELHVDEPSFDGRNQH